MAKGRDGVGYAACDSEGDVLVHALGADGAPVAGWPVRLPGSTASVYANLFTIGCGDVASSLALTSRGAIVVAVADGPAAHLHVIAPNGEPQPGWPRPFPGDGPQVDGIGGNGCRGFALAPDDSVVAWGYEGVEQDIELSAARTEFTVYEPDGRTRSGWPRGSTGAASRPVVASDGSVVYVSASGKVWRHEADGAIGAGWPYQLASKTGPYLSPADRITVFTGNATSGEAIALGASGEVIGGWPVSLGWIETRCLFGDTPCSGSIAPAFGPDGTLYVSLANGSITAIDTTGRVVAGWPADLGDRTHAIGLRVDDAERIVAEAVVCGSEGENGCAEKARSTTLVFRPDGTPVDGPAN